MFIHTDLGHDPDDAIALSYLLEYGHIPDVICLHPGYIGQIEILQGFFKACDFNCSVFTSKEVSDSDKYVAGKHELLMSPSNIWEPSNKLIKKFWDQLKPTKAMHDVLAAMMLIDPSSGVWVREKPKWLEQRKMTTEPTNEEIYSLIDLNLKGSLNVQSDT